MKRWMIPTLFSVGFALAGGEAVAKDNKKEATPSVAKSVVPQLQSLAGLMAEAKWGMTRKDVIQAYSQAAGVIDKDYDSELRKLAPGSIEMRRKESERDDLKRAFEKSLIEFGDVPTGLDATGLKNEYTYKNRESILAIQRAGKKRVFFFIGEKLWKVYDEVSLAQGGAYGASYQEALSKISSGFGVTGHIIPADGKDVRFTTVEWQDDTTHLRILDRSGERIVGIVLEDRAVLANLPQLRSNKGEDPFAMDPSVAAVTKGGVSDPNAANAAASASARRQGTAPKKK